MLDSRKIIICNSFHNDSFPDGYWGDSLVRFVFAIKGGHNDNEKELWRTAFQTALVWRSLTDCYKTPVKSDNYEVEIKTIKDKLEICNKDEKYTETAIIYKDYREKKEEFKHEKYLEKWKNLIYITH